jgi:hypothetical protein
MKKEEIEKYFGKVILTGYGDCYVKGYSDNKKYIILYENDEAFAFSIEDFVETIKQNKRIKA